MPGIIMVFLFLVPTVPATLGIFLIPIMHASYGLAEWVELVCPGKDFPP